MLPLWSDSLQIVLAPERVTLVLKSAGFKSRELFSKSMPCAAAEHGEHAWQPALRAMKQLLQENKSSAVNTTVMLSNHFVRYQLIKAQPDLSTHEEEQAFVRFCFSEVYGDEANHWALRWGAGLDVAPQVASAIDQLLIDQIEEALNTSGAKLSSLQPYLMAAFNHVRQFIDVKPNCFVLVEPGSACVSFLRDGDWQLLHSSRLGTDWAAELPWVLGREFQMAGTDSERSQLLLCLPSAIDHKRLLPDSHSLRILTMTSEMLLQDVVQAVVAKGVK